MNLKKLYSIEKNIDCSLKSLKYFSLKSKAVNNLTKLSNFIEISN